MFLIQGLRWEKKYICHLQLKTDIRHFEIEKIPNGKKILYSKVDFRKLNVNL